LTGLQGPKDSTGDEGKRHSRTSDQSFAREARNLLAFGPQPEGIPDLHLGLWLNIGAACGIAFSIGH
jgi:hypothetical protein